MLNKLNHAFLFNFVFTVSEIVFLIACVNLFFKVEKGAVFLTICFLKFISCLNVIKIPVYHFEPMCVQSTKIWTYILFPKRKMTSTSCHIFKM